MSSDGGSPAFPGRPSTGTAEDLTGILIEADERRVLRDGLPVPVKSAWRRAALEAPLNLVGRGLSLAMTALPASWAFVLQEAGLRALVNEGGRPFEPSAELDAARALIERTEEETGRPAALLVLISHGPVHGELAYLNIELVRHAQWALRRLRPACRPRLVIAVDPFALDTVSVTEEALYAGFMGHYHLGIDRAALSRSRRSAWLLQATAWHRMPFRLLEGLSGGREFVMALAGGVPSTTRGRYAVREWLARQRAGSPLARDPSVVLARLRAVPAYREFERLRPGWLHPRSVWRCMEAWLMACVEEPCLSGGGPSSAETGVLVSPARDACRACLEALLLPGDAAAAALAALEEEFQRETPFRARLFKLVASRVLARGRPVVFLPLVHRTGDGVRLEFGRSWAWREGSAANVSARDSQGLVWKGSTDAFSRVLAAGSFS
ncbi:MAG: hypothetical protein WC943_15035 [Elusimicrobiota bacterium]|jgi:hypothetical protein